MAFVEKCNKNSRWDFIKCKIMSNIEEVNKYQFGGRIKLDDFVRSWGEKDWLDTVDGSMIIILDAGEVMYILLGDVSGRSGSGNVIIVIEMVASVVLN